METKTPRWAVIPLAVVAIAAVAGPAEAKCRPVNEGADYGPCVTPAEFDAVHVGMPLRRAERIMDTRGRPAGRALMEGMLAAVGHSMDEIGPRRFLRVRIYPGCVNAEGESDQTVIAYNTRRPGNHIAAAASV